jgi:hypothetical protein
VAGNPCCVVGVEDAEVLFAAAIGYPTLLIEGRHSFSCPATTSVHVHLLRGVTIRFSDNVGFRQLYCLKDRSLPEDYCLRPRFHR